MQKSELISWVIRVIKRIGIEFIFPAIAATIWFFFSKSPSLGGWGVFFVSTSWFTSQIFRIIKQQRVEGEFDLVKSKLGDMVERIELQTKKVIGYSTGADSNGFLFPIADNHYHVIRLFIVNESEFTCYMVGIDMYEYDDTGKSIFLHKTNLEVFHPVLWYKFDFIIPDFQNSKKFKIHFHTRVGCSYVQYILAEKINNQYLIAYTKWVNGNIQYVIPENFPYYDKENPSELFKEMREKPING